MIFSLLAAAPAFGQTSLLVARTFIHVNGAGIPYSGDSTTLAYNSQLLVNQYNTWKIEATGNWALKFRSIGHTYDANGNLLYYLDQVGDDVNGWTDSSRYNYTYDMDGRELSSLEEKWDGISWFLISYGDLYYSDFVSTQTPTLAAFEVFPNPASTSVTLKSEDLRQAMVYDQQGLVVCMQNIHGQHQETIQVGNLPSDNYYLQVIGNDGRPGAKSLQIRR